MKLARPILAAVTVGVVLAVVFAVFAVELASAQTRSRNEIRTEVQDRAQLTASLINSLFNTVNSSAGTYEKEYGATVDAKALETAAAGERYALVAEPSGRVVQAAGDFHGTAVVGVPTSTLARVAAAASAAPGGVSYHLGDLFRDGGSFIADYIVAFPAASGQRLLVTGLDPGAVAVKSFFGGDLRTVPGVNGEVNYLVDGNGLVVSSSDPSLAAGTVPVHLSASSLVRASGESHGYYYQAARLDNSGWRVLLVAPDGALFATVNGAREYVPWIIFVALVLVAVVAAVLAWRVVRSAEVVSAVNAKLASVNQELSHANESLQQRAAELARSNEELESFASIASHDLREPLRKVMTFTEQLTVLEADRLSDKGRDYLTRANSAADRMQNLIDDLLKFSRVSTQGRSFERVDLAELTSRVLGDLESPVEEAGARVDVGPLPVITADPLQMQQLMQNLISNAVKFRRPGVAPEIAIRGEVQDGKVRLTVADNGIGFEPRYSARIFRIFERLHGRSEYPGTGIGLALCRKITDRHGGTIEAESQPGEGATFTVTLPVEQPAGSLGFGVGPRVEEVPTGARL